MNYGKGLHKNSMNYGKGLHKNSMNYGKGLHKKEWRQDSDVEHMLYCNQLSW